jgi:hypothetical protein
MPPAGSPIVGRRVFLTRREAEEARQIGLARQRSNDSSAVYDGRIDAGSSSEDINVIGALGELAFEIWSGIPMDRTLAPRSGGADFVMADGTRVDVKSTSNA